MRIIRDPNGLPVMWHGVNASYWHLGDDGFMHKTEALTPETATNQPSDARNAPAVDEDDPTPLLWKVFVTLCIVAIVVLCAYILVAAPATTNAGLHQL